MNPTVLGLALLAAAVPAQMQSSVIRPGANLVMSGMPPIPASVAQRCARYGESRSARREVWHPVRREMLISTRFGETDQIHHVRFPGGARVQLTFPPRRSQLAVYEPKEGKYFLFFKDAGGSERYQMYRYDHATKATALLTDGRSLNVPGAWSSGGDQFLYRSTKRTGKDLDLWVMNPTRPETDRLLCPVTGGGWRAYDWSPDDRQVLVIESISNDESYLWLVDAASGEKALITRKGEPQKTLYSSAKFSKDGRGVFVMTDKGSDFQRLGYIDLATKRLDCLTGQLPWDVEQFDLSPDGRMIAFTTNEEGLSVLHLLHVESRTVSTLPGLPVGIINDLEWHRNGTDLGFSLESTRAPSDAYSYNVPAHKLERWTYSEVGGFDAESLPEPELVRWTSFDGRQISGFLYKPPARFQGRRPVMIRIHGGPANQARPGFLGRVNYYLNELGVAVILPNVRGSSGYGKAFLELDNGFGREGAYKDIGALLDWIGTRPDLDADRVMVTGSSFGGHMTLAAAAFYPRRVRCALDIVGPSNLVTFIKSADSYRLANFREEYGDERDRKVADFLQRIAPLKHAAKITMPLFVVAGNNDRRVPVAESEQIVARVRKNGTPVWYLLAKDEGHGFERKGNQDFLFYASVWFTSEYLLKH
jgi:dipeptidyl aminopeptidase/acylaminoacyl peptidase